MIHPRLTGRTERKEVRMLHHHNTRAAAGFNLPLLLLGVAA